MLQKVQACSQLIAYDVAYGAIENSRVGIRLGFAAKTALSLTELYYRGHLSRRMKVVILSEIVIFGLSYLFVEWMLNLAPGFFANNFIVTHRPDANKFEVDVTSVANSEIIIAIQCAALLAMSFLTTFAADSSFKIIKYEPSNTLFVLIMSLPCTIFLSGFFGFINVDFNKIILDRAGLCMKWESLRYGSCRLCS